MIKIPLFLLLLLPLRGETPPDALIVAKLVQMSFPGSRVQRTSAERWLKEFRGYPSSRFFAEALYFEVTGQATNQESTAASDVLDEHQRSKVRLLRTKVISSDLNSKGRPVYAVLLDYTFLGVAHCSQCVRLAKVVLFSDVETTRSATTKLLEGANNSITKAEFVDVTGDGAPELLVEASGGVNAVDWTTLYLFDVRQRDLRLLTEQEIRYDSMGSGFKQTKYEKQLDLAKTRERKGKALVFRVTTYVREKERLEIPDVSEETVTLDSTLIK